MKTKLTISGFILLLLFACTYPEEKLIGTWEYDSYEVDESGIGMLAAFIPDDWKKPIDEWLEKTKGLTNSTLTFYPDGTYKESFSGAAEEFTSVKGHYKVAADFTEIRLRTNGKEQAMNLIELEDNYFIYTKEFKQYNVPLTLKISYKRVK